MTVPCETCSTPERCNCLPPLDDWKDGHPDAWDYDAVLKENGVVVNGNGNRGLRACWAWGLREPPRQLLFVAILLTCLEIMRGIRERYISLFASVQNHLASIFDELAISPDENTHRVFVRGPIR